MNGDEVVIMAAGYAAMMLGKRMRINEYPDGFAFCPYNPGTIEYDSWMLGCVDAASKSENNWSQ